MTDSAHPSLDDLADMHEGLLPDERHAELSAHVSSCRVCMPAMAALDEVETMLTTTGSARPPMPRAVAASLDEALRRVSDERAAGVPSLTERRLSSGRGSSAEPRRSAWALVAGAAAAAVVIGYAGFTLLGDPSSVSDSAQSPAGGPAGYTAGGLGSRGSDGSVPRAAAGAGAGPGAGSPRDSPDTPASVPPLGTTRDPILTRKTLSAYALSLAAGIQPPVEEPRRCADIHVRSADSVTAVRWNGAMAVVVVDPAARRATVYDCTGNPSRLFSTSY